MKVQEKRGSQLHKTLDRYLGWVVLLCLGALLRIKGLITSRTPKEHNTYLLVCIGAIGDLILLTEAARIQLKGQCIVLACSNSNLSCALMYQDFYAAITPIDVSSLFDLHRICQTHNIDVVYDSTQWANIGPVQVGFARLMDRGLTTIGFKSKSHIRNRAYHQIVEHAVDVHEVVNFVNLLAGRTVLNSNEVLLRQLSHKYQQHGYRTTHKVLFHMWPSGARAYLKEWPESHWIELAEYFNNRGYQIYLSGSPVDKARNAHFLARAGLNNIVNIAGFYDLEELSGFIANEIECAISVNTGVLHLVASLGGPLIGLHGPTNPVRWGPLGVNSVALLPRAGNFAYLHYGFEYPVEDSEAYALDQLSVDQVTKAFERLSTAEC